MFAKESEKKLLERLYANDQLVFRYCHEDGSYAEGCFPTNPNGSFHDIAGICNREGTIFGLMPHPERHIHNTQHPRWTALKNKKEGDGLQIFRSGVEYAVKNI